MVRYEFPSGGFLLKIRRVSDREARTEGSTKSPTGSFGIAALCALQVLITLQFLSSTLRWSMGWYDSCMRRGG